MHSFSEKQRFRLWWFWLLLLAIDLIPLYALYTQFYLGEPMGNKPMTDTQLVVFSSGMLLLNLLFFVMKLATKVDEKGISWSLFPLAKKSLTWDQIQTAEVKKIGFVGGFGIRLFTQCRVCGYGQKAHWIVLLFQTQRHGNRYHLHLKFTIG